MAVTSALASDSAARAGLSRDQLLELYYWMRLTRSLEERLVNLYRQTKVVGGLFRSLGQEACAVGSAYALRPRGRALAADPEPRLHAGQGRDAARGAAAVHGQGRLAHARPGAQHPLRRRRGPELRRPDLASGRHGAGHGRRHARVQAAEGAAGRAGLRGRRRHLAPAPSTRGSTSPRCSAARWSSSWRTTATPTPRPPSKQCAAERLADKAAGYGIPGVRADGNDVIAAYQVTRDAVARARRGEGVTLVELMTYRRKGHAEHDNQSLRARRRDRPLGPGERSARPLRPAAHRRPKAWPPSELEAIDARVQAEIDDGHRRGRAVAAARAARLPRRGLRRSARGAGALVSRGRPERGGPARAPGELGDARWLRPPTSRPSARACSRRWSATRASSAWARTSARTAAPSR